MLEYRPLQAGCLAAQQRNAPSAIAEFCALLRTSKLLFFHNDRIEPGGYDGVARELASMGTQVAQEAARASLNQEGRLALATIRDHVAEIEERLRTEPEDRDALDEKRLEAAATALPPEA